MKLLLISIIFIIPAYFVLRYIKRKSSNTSSLPPRSGIQKWMEMSNLERNSLDQKQRIDTMKRKKLLLDSIRKEYNDLNK